MVAQLALAEGVVNFYNWADYIGESTIRDFEEEYGIKVNYDQYDSSEIVEAELRAAGILVRSMAGKPQIDRSLRISIGTTKQMQRFWQTYQAIDSEL